MFYGLKKLLLEALPSSWLTFYHLLLAKLGAFLYGYPSEKLIVIGVTGTSGKSTTVFILHDLLAKSGLKVGSLSTIAFRIGSELKLNDRKMTMLGRFQTQRFLRRMVRVGCTHAIIETTSEGVEQYRHRGIHYDLLLFTNLYPEHIEAHGSFLNYKNAKLKLFDYLEKSSQKVIDGVVIPRCIIANSNNEHASDFLNFQVEKKYAYQDKSKEKLAGLETINIDWASDADPQSFSLEGEAFRSPFLGKHNAENLIGAVVVGRALGLSFVSMSQLAHELPPVPGRLEFITLGQPWEVVVDYAFEPKAMASIYTTLHSLGAPKRYIQVLGATGGGRDKSRRSTLGKMAGEFADIVIITNEDPYDEDPREIMEQVKKGALEAGKKEGENLFIVEDRRSAIREAMTRAKTGDCVLITGKGCEQAIVGARGKKISWDDRLVSREETQKILEKM